MTAADRLRAALATTHISRSVTHVQKADLTRVLDEHAKMLEACRFALGAVAMCRELLCAAQNEVLRLSRQLAKTFDCGNCRACVALPACEQMTWLQRGGVVDGVSCPNRRLPAVVAAKGVT